MHWADCIASYGKKSSMESLSPSLKCLYSIKRCLAQGLSLFEALKQFVEQCDSPFSVSLMIWLNYFESNNLENFPDQRWSSNYQPMLIESFRMGLTGCPIEERIDQLILEVEAAHRLEVDEFITLLPLKALMPVFLFQFPAFLLLIFGPVLSEFFKGVLSV